MPTQAYTYLALTDGTTTVTFEDGSGGQTNYKLARDSWAPNVAQLSASQIGSSPYANVVEEFEIIIRDTTAAAALDRLATLERLLDQADRWRRGENQTPVTLNYAPVGSTLAATGTPYQVVVLGRAGDTPLVTLPPTFNWVGKQFAIAPVRVAFLRRPQWLLGTTAATSAGAANPNIMTATLGSSLPGYSPARIAVAGIQGIPIQSSNSALYLLASAVASGIQLFDLTAPGAPFTSQADSAAAALGGNVVRYTPTGTTEATMLIGAIGGPGGLNLGAVSAFAAVRNNGSTLYRLRWGVANGASYLTTVTWSRPVPVDAAISTPRIIPLGTLAVRQNTSLYLGVTASAAASSLDIDYIVLLLSGSYASGVVRCIDRLDVSGISASGTATFTWDPQPLTDTAPIASISGRSVISPPSPTLADFPTFDAYVPPHVTGTAVLVALLGTTPSRWVLAASGTTGASLTATVTRYNAYLTPA